MLLLTRLSRATCAAWFLIGVSAPAFAAPLVQGVAASAGGEPSQTSSPVAVPRVLPAGAFETVLPAETMLWIGVDRVDVLRRQFAASPVGRMLQDEAMRPTLETLEREFSGLREHLRAELGEDPTELLEFLEGPAALAVCLPGAVHGSAAPAAGDALPVSVLLLADVGGQQRQAAVLMARLVARLGALDSGLELGQRTVGDVRLTSLTQWPCAEGDTAEDDDADFDAADEADEASDIGDISDIDDLDEADEVDLVDEVDSRTGEQSGTAEAVLSYGFRDALLVVSFEWKPGPQPVLDRVLSALDATPGKSNFPASSLASRADFAASQAATPGDLRCWADAGGFTRLMLALDDAHHEADPAERHAIDSLGLAGLGSLSQSLTLGADGSDWSAGMEWQGEGWIPDFMRMLCQSGETRTLAFVPADCRSATVVHMDLPGLFDGIVGMLLDLRVMTPADITEALTGTEEVLGFNPRDELLELFDGEVAVVTVGTDREDAFPGTTLDPVNFGLLLGLADGAALAALVDDAIDASGLRAARIRESFEGMTIDHITVLPPLALHYAILDDVLLASQSDSVLRSMLRLHANPDGPSLAALPSFRQALARLPAPHGMLSYSDTAAQLEGAIRSLKMLPEFLAGISAGMHGADRDALEWMQGMDWLMSMPLPDPAVVRRYINGPTLTTVVVDEHGARLRSIGP